MADQGTAQRPAEAEADTNQLATTIESLRLDTKTSSQDGTESPKSTKDTEVLFKGRKAASTSSNRYILPHQRAKASTSSKGSTGESSSTNQLAAAFSPVAPAFIPINPAPANAVQQPKNQPPLKYDRKPGKATPGFDPHRFSQPFFTQNDVPPTPPPTQQGKQSKQSKQSVSEFYKLVGIPNLAAKAKKYETKQRRKDKQQPKGTPKASAINAPAFDLIVRAPSEQPRSPKSPHLRLIKRPEPTRTYLRRAQQEPQFRDGPPRPLLIILDLNGTLLYRKNRGSNFVTRPWVNEFLHYLLTNHKLVIWSSARPENVASMCKKLFTEEQYEKLVGVWSRDNLRLSYQHYREKVQVYKQLSWIWRDHNIASSCVDGHEWDQDNTVLIDDSEEKAASEPYNLLKIDEFEGIKEQMEQDVLGQVVEYLEVLRTVKDVSTCMRAQPYSFRSDVNGYDWQKIVDDMHKAAYPMSETLEHLDCCGSD